MRLDTSGSLTSIAAARATRAESLDRVGVDAARHGGRDLRRAELDRAPGHGLAGERGGRSGDAVTRERRADLLAPAGAIPDRDDDAIDARPRHAHAEHVDGGGHPLSRRRERVDASGRERGGDPGDRIVEPASDLAGALERRDHGRWRG